MAAAEQILTRLFAKADIRMDGKRPWDLQVHDPRFFPRVVSGGTLGFGEAYMDGWWDCGDLEEMCFRAARARLDEMVPFNLKTAATALVSVLCNLQSRRRARKVGEVHYDLGNDFFAAMLGPDLQYSCAYFRETAELATAQSRKLDLICRKLGLTAGMRMLDIGCGWGGLARYAAEHHGCKVVGITISREQQAYAADACRGLPIEIRLQDYREVTESFDRIASVGMMEHVGYKNYRTYMEAACRCLRENGLFLCHTIAGNVSRIGTDPWIHRYIFPNSMLPSPAQVTRAAEGLFVLEDVHNFGSDYGRTLLAWERNFREAWPRFRKRYGERFGRMWRYYLLSCAGAFRARNIELFQFVLSKGGVPGGYESVR
ncbi:MAG: cyclopropane-fatty-acyl-phospholipid synthase [Verrucomicrobia bacterium RIFCSPLOWO2_12_FULL_64_8]|nr:MAG: cyclopropane-fatty-acyl-phospholipid synthase [Verrucomicrobia bacterium RIFCSPLOWO2_12_FULL_64_8]